MKTFIILVQAVALAAAAWITRPTEAEFRGYVQRRLARKADDLLPRDAANRAASVYLDHCTFRDRWLWVEVTREDRIVYVGALAHWIDRSVVERNEPADQVAVAKPGIDR